MNRRQLLIAVLALAVIGLGVVAYLVFNSSSNDDLLAGQTQYSITITPQDRTLGNPKAKVTIVEYAAPTCPHCAHFNETMFPQMKKDYIDTGKVYYVFRVFPLSQVDIAAESIARCLPADNYFQFIDLLFRNQPKWDPDGYQIPDVRGALLSMAQIAGMGADQANACIDNATAQQQAEAVGIKAQTDYGVNSTPTFIVNGYVAPPFGSYDDVKKFLDKMLAKS